MRQKLGDKHSKNALLDDSLPGPSRRRSLPSCRVSPSHSSPPSSLGPRGFSSPAPQSRQVKMESIENFDRGFLPDGPSSDFHTPLPPPPSPASNHDESRLSSPYNSFSNSAISLDTSSRAYNVSTWRKAAAFKPDAFRPNLLSRLGCEEFGFGALL